jgi:hypothetical protein
VIWTSWKSICLRTMLALQHIPTMILHTGHTSPRLEHSQLTWTFTSTHSVRRIKSLSNNISAQTNTPMKHTHMMSAKLFGPVKQVSSSSLAATSLLVSKHLTSPQQPLLWLWLHSLRCTDRHRAVNSLIFTVSLCPIWSWRKIRMWSTCETAKKLKIWDYLKSLEMRH